MSLAPLRYDPDSWAHDLDELWAPLAGLAAGADWTSEAWLSALGVEEFFDHRLLGQPRVHTPWLCLAAAAVAAAAARQRALTAAGQVPAAAGDSDMLAVTAFELAVSLQELRWQGELAGGGVISTAQLAQAGRDALAPRLDPAGISAPTAICLVAGWLSHSGRTLRPAGDFALPPLPLLPERPASYSLRQAAADIANCVLAGRAAGQLEWGTAHLVERLACGLLDDLVPPARPDDPPAQSRAKVLLIAGEGDVGVFEARRQRSLLAAPRTSPVPDLARLAFVHVSDEFLDSVSMALAASLRVDAPAAAGEVPSWNLHLRGGRHPLAERAVAGRSAGLAAYIAFRSLCALGTFAASDVAFTGQVFADGRTGAVQGASGKIGAAGAHGIRLVVHPAGQAWRDPGATVQLEGVELAEDAVIAAAHQLRGLRSYLEATCRLVAPAPWLRTWLDRQQPSRELPLLEVGCRQVRGHETAADRASAAGLQPAPPPGDDADPPVRNWMLPPEPDVPPSPVHLLAGTYPHLSFALSADAGSGSTMAAKRIVAEAARQALDSLRASVSGPGSAVFVLPLYVPLGALPASWDDIVRIGTAALPAPAAPGLDMAAAVARVLRGAGPRAWRPLVVIDGIDRIRSDNDSRNEPERDFLSLVTGAPALELPGWRPRQPAQLVLFGRRESPAQHRAAAALRRARPGAVAEMVIEPLTDRTIDHFISCVARAGDPPAGQLLAGRARDLAANPLLLALSVIAGPPEVPDSGVTDLLDRGLDVLLGDLRWQRRSLAEIAFRAAIAKDEPAGEFTLTDLADAAASASVAAALVAHDTELARAMALDRDERRSLQSAENDTHLITASDAGWRFFHDRAFAFLVADRVARHAAGEGADDDAAFALLGGHLADPRWADVIEATGRLLELHEEQVSVPS